MIKRWIQALFIAPLCLQTTQARALLNGSADTIFNIDRCRQLYDKTVVISDERYFFWPGVFFFSRTLFSYFENPTSMDYATFLDLQEYSPKISSGVNQVCKINQHDNRKKLILIRKTFTEELTRQTENRENISSLIEMILTSLKLQSLSDPELATCMGYVVQNKLHNHTLAEQYFVNAIQPSLIKPHCYSTSEHAYYWAAYYNHWGADGVKKNRQLSMQLLEQAGVLDKKFGHLTLGMVKMFPEKNTGLTPTQELSHLNKAIEHWKRVDFLTTREEQIAELIKQTNHFFRDKLPVLTPQPDNIIAETMKIWLIEYFRLAHQSIVNKADRVGLVLHYAKRVGLKDVDLLKKGFFPAVIGLQQDSDEETIKQKVIEACAQEAESRMVECLATFEKNWDVNLNMEKKIYLSSFLTKTTSTSKKKRIEQKDIIKSFMTDIDLDIKKLNNHREPWAYDARKRSLQDKLRLLMIKLYLERFCSILKLPNTSFHRVTKSDSLFDLKNVDTVIKTARLLKCSKCVSLSIKMRKTAIELNEIKSPGELEKIFTQQPRLENTKDYGLYAILKYLKHENNQFEKKKNHMENNNVYYPDTNSIRINAHLYALHKITHKTLVEISILESCWSCLDVFEMLTKERLQIKKIKVQLLKKKIKAINKMELVSEMSDKKFNWRHSIPTDISYNATPNVDSAYILLQLFILAATIVSGYLIRKCLTETHKKNKKIPTKENGNNGKYKSNNKRNKKNGNKKIRGENGEQREGNTINGSTDSRLNNVTGNADKEAGKQPGRKKATSTHTQDQNHDKIQSFKKLYNTLKDNWRPVDSILSYHYKRREWVIDDYNKRELAKLKTKRDRDPSDKKTKHRILKLHEEIDAEKNQKKNKRKKKNNPRPAKLPEILSQNVEEDNTAYLNYLEGNYYEKLKKIFNELIKLSGDTQVGSENNSYNNSNPCYQFYHFIEKCDEDIFRKSSVDNTNQSGNNKYKNAMAKKPWEHSQLTGTQAEEENKPRKKYSAEEDIDTLFATHYDFFSEDEYKNIVSCRLTMTSDPQHLFDEILLKYNKEKWKHIITSQPFGEILLKHTKEYLLNTAELKVYQKIMQSMQLIYIENKNMTRAISNILDERSSIQFPVYDRPCAAKHASPVNPFDLLVKRYLSYDIQLTQAESNSDWGVDVVSAKVNLIQIAIEIFNYCNPDNAKKTRNTRHGRFFFAKDREQYLIQKTKKSKKPAVTARENRNFLLHNGTVTSQQRFFFEKGMRDTLAHRLFDLADNDKLLSFRRYLHPVLKNIRNPMGAVSPDVLSEWKKTFPPAKEDLNHIVKIEKILNRWTLVLQGANEDSKYDNEIAFTNAICYELRNSQFYKQYTGEIARKLNTHAI